MIGSGEVEDLLRRNAPRVLGALVRRHGQFDACEDAVQEALLAAATQWPEQGVPAAPDAWLRTVATRRLTDFWRADSARRRREADVAALEPVDPTAPAADESTVERDDTLRLLFLCCHPALTPASQVCLTLRAVGGLTTAEIARAFLVPEATMAQRVSRAKQLVRKAGATFTMPPPHERDSRLRAVLHVLYLVFTEGHTTTSGPALTRTDLTAEAIRLTRTLHAALPDEGEVAGLLALMLLTDARRAARTTVDGALVPLAEQDRTLWNAERIAEGAALIEDVLARTRTGPYQVQAAIAAVHAEARDSDHTDWRQIVALYTVLEQLAPSPVVILNKAVALAMVDGPRAGLDLLSTVDDDPRMADHHRPHAVRAHLLELAGDNTAAHASYLEAAHRTTSQPERQYLHERAAALAVHANTSAISGNEPGTTKRKE